MPSIRATVHGQKRSVKLRITGDAAWTIEAMASATARTGSRFVQDALRAQLEGEDLLEALQQHARTRGVDPSLAAASLALRYAYSDERASNPWLEIRAGMPNDLRAHLGLLRAVLRAFVRRRDVDVFRSSMLQYLNAERSPATPTPPVVQVVLPLSRD